MKSKILAFIEKANQVLLFIAAITFITIVCIEFLDHLIDRSYNPPKIKISKEGDEASGKALEPHYIKAYVTQLNDVYIFSICSDNINPNIYHKPISKYKNEEKQAYFSGSSGNPIADNTVNLIFVEGDTNKPLLKQDAYISLFSEAKLDDEQYEYRFDKNIYLIATVDTNNNGYLDEGDQRDLYVSNYNGVGLERVLENVTGYRLTGNNRLLITQGNETNKQFYTYQVNSGEPKRLNTDISIVRSK